MKGYFSDSNRVVAIKIRSEADTKLTATKTQIRRSVNKSYFHRLFFNKTRKSILGGAKRTGSPTPAVYTDNSLIAESENSGRRQLSARGMPKNAVTLEDVLVNPRYNQLLTKNK